MSAETQALTAKVVLLGDHGTGKSTLIRSLNKLNDASILNATSATKDADRSSSLATEDVVFQTITIAANEMNNMKSNLVLKIWEYSSNLSKEETELVLRGALFCIITFDLRNPESANSAFNNWLVLKESFMMESFLFVVGTNLDHSTSRRVEIADLCKACAQKDGIYLEVSNKDGTNIALLKRMLIQRINFMLSIRDNITRQLNLSTGAGGDSDDDDELDPTKEQAHDKKKRYEKLFAANGSSLLDTTFLEQEIISDSVGSILSSSLGIEFWPGLESEEEKLKSIGANICERVRELALDPSSAPATPLEFILQSVPPMTQDESESLKKAPSPDTDELKNIFEIMGFALPPSLLQQDGDLNENNSISTSMTGQRPPLGSSVESQLNQQKTPQQKQQVNNSTIKLKVMLPTGASTEIQIYPGYHIGRQVETFLVQHNMEDDLVARKKLTKAATQIAKKNFRA